MSISHALVTQLKQAGATIHADILEIGATGDRPVRQLRVIEGRVFGRGQTDGRWSEADWRETPVDQLLEFYVDDSPVATWLRENGTDLMQSALLSLVWPR